MAQGSWVQGGEFQTIVRKRRALGGVSKLLPAFSYDFTQMSSLPGTE